MVRLPLEIASEWLIVRRNGEQLSQYQLEENARRDYEGWMGAALYRRWVIRPRRFRCVEAKDWDEA
jgi:hypothetical protein